MTKKKKKNQIFLINIYEKWREFWVHRLLNGNPRKQHQVDDIIIWTLRKNLNNFVASLGLWQIILVFNVKKAELVSVNLLEKALFKRIPFKSYFERKYYVFKWIRRNTKYINLRKNESLRINQQIRKHIFYKYAHWNEARQILCKGNARK